jgi:phosphatidylglycerol:prolipoprotein diacylglycerol transferase
MTLPESWGGLPLFGLGVLLGLWALVCVVYVVWQLRRPEGDRDLVANIPLLAIVAAGIYFAPQLFGPSGLPIRGFGLMVLLGVLSGHAVAVWLARRANLAPDAIFSLAVWLMIGGFLGARTFYVLQYWNTFLMPSPDAPEVLPTLMKIVQVTEGGLVLYGSIIGGTIALGLYCWRHKLSPLAIGDIVAPALMIGLAFGRIGCFLNGCCYGGACELPWAVQFPPESPAYESQFVSGQILGLILPEDPNARPRIEAIIPGSLADAAGIEEGDTIVAVAGRVVTTAGAARGMLLSQDLQEQQAAVALESGARVRLKVPQLSQPVHPTQIYSAINAALLCTLLITFWPFRRRDGAVFGLMLITYPIARFVLEVIRGDEGAIFATGLTISQNVSVAVLALSVIYWWFVLRQPVGSIWPLPEDHPLSMTYQNRILKEQTRSA